MRSHGVNEETIELQGIKVMCVREANDPVCNDHGDNKFSWNQLEFARSLLPENTGQFSTYSDPLEWVLLLEDRTTTESINQSQAAYRLIDNRIWLATVSHYVRGHIYHKGTKVQWYTYQLSQLPISFQHRLHKHVYLKRFYKQVYAIR